MSIDDRLDAAGQRLRSQADQIEIPPPPIVRPDRRGAALAVALAALVTALLVIFAPASPDVDDAVSPEIPPPPASSTTAESERDEPFDLTESIESAAIVDGAILLPDGFHPQDAIESADGLMVVRAERRPQGPESAAQEPQSVMAIDMIDGEVIWMIDIPGGETLLGLSRETVFVAQTSGIKALELGSGDALWTATLELPFDLGEGPDRREFIPSDIAVGFDALWLASERGAVARVDVDDGSIVDVFGLTGDDQPDGEPIFVRDIAVSDRHLWVAGGIAGLIRIDPESGQVDRVTPDELGHDVNSVVAAGSDVVVGGKDSADVSGVISLVHGSRLEPIASTALDGFVLVVEANDRPALWMNGSLRPIQPVGLEVGAPLERTHFVNDRGLARSDGSWIVAADERLIIPFPTDTPTAPLSADSAPLFGVGIYTDSLLLFDDGLDGILAVEPDERLATRSTLEGQRAGSEPYSMIRVGDALVVGWSEIFAVDIATREATSLGLATIFVPAAEPDRVWMIDWPGGAIGLGTPTVWQVGTDGEQLTEPVTLDIDGFPAHGIPGGLAVETDLGIELWDAASQTARSLFGDENSRVLDAFGNDVVWCRVDCSELVVTDLSTMTTEGFVIPPGFEIVINSSFASGQHLSPDGRFVAVLVRRAEGDDTALWLLDRANENITTVSDEDTQVEFLTWGSDWTQIFASSYSYGGTETTVWRYDLETGHFSSATLPFGGATTPVAVDDSVAGSYIGEPGEDSPCERITDLASAGDPDCWFGF